MLGNMNEKLGTLTALGYSMVGIARLNDPLSGILALEPSPVEGQSLQQNNSKMIKRKGEKNLKT